MEFWTKKNEITNTKKGRETTNEIQPQKHTPDWMEMEHNEI